ncbi:MAG: hypothetical protein JWQ21_1157 [Herminiimonas sp.]|nr:hypothetical protein [Herminiimonas sp.]
MDPARDSPNNPMNHPDEQPCGTDGPPRFGRLLIVLAIAVILAALMSFISEAYFSR